MKSLTAVILGFALVFTGQFVHAQDPEARGRVMVGGAWVDPQQLPKLADAIAGEASPPEAPEQRGVFGTKDFAYLNLGPCEFMPRGASEFAKVASHNCHRLGLLSSGLPGPLDNELFVGAEVHLPNGVLIDQITIFYRDTHTTADLGVSLERVSTTGLNAIIVALDPGPVFSGGDTSVTVDLATPHTVDNTTNKYSFNVVLHRSAMNPNEQTALYRVRIRYRQQTSPAPASATFQDVPTSHPFFQFIEALAAAGITFGCSASPPLFCPDAALTRGQMAAFLGRALGLHFPN
jgi:hypothetical protein